MKSKRSEETTLLFKALRDHHSRIKYSTSDENVQHPKLLPELRPYQADAVRWMLHRERLQEQTDLFLNFDENGASSSGTSSDSNGIEISYLPKGGILADEMGLGKTVEVIACILNHPYPDRLAKMDVDEKTSRSVGTPEKLIGNHQCVGENSEERPDTDAILDNIEVKSEKTLEQTTVDTIESTVRSDSPVAYETFEDEESQSEEEVIPAPKKRKFIEPEKHPETVDNEIEQLRTARNETGKLETDLKKTNKKLKNATKKKLEKSCEKPKGKNSLKEGLRQWYEQKLLEGNVNARRVNEWALYKQKVHCLCGTQEENDLVECSECQHVLHANCIDVEVKKKDRTWPVLCPQCWSQKDCIDAGTTLIISPGSIMKQWVNEINQHIAKPGLKVLVYQGVRQHGYLQPHKFRNYDVVITTYDVIRSELVYTEVSHERSRRYAKRFFAPTCPLLSVRWWRLCLDEAQMVEGTTSKTAEMASKLMAVHRWGVTGTPVQKSLHDLYGLLLFLGMYPYCEPRSWREDIYKPYQCGRREPLHTLISVLMWRSSKADVEDQIKLPPQSEEIHWLNFSPVEEHFYRRTHGECAAEFNERLVKCKEDADTALRCLRLTTVNYILAPLLRLRQACSHPQAVRGNSLTAKNGTMTMHELLESLIKKTCAEAEDALREYIAALNGIAAMHIICEEWANAVEKYRDVLRISEEYKTRLKVDSLQRIHTMHNLAEILEAKPINFQPTLRDSSLREEARELELKYMKKCETNVEAAKRLVSTLGAIARDLEKEMSEMDEDSWWVDITNHLLLQGAEDDLLTRVYNSLLDNRKSIPEQSRSSIINRVSTHQGIKQEVLMWLEKLEQTRQKAIKSLRAVEVADILSLLNQAVCCHLRTHALKARNKICQLCSCEENLKKYERRLFDVKKDTQNEMLGEVKVLAHKKESSWQATEQERVLRVILSMGRMKKAPKECVKAGNTFMKLMDALRKEFKVLRLLWSRLNDQTAAQDEVNMCKLRLRLRLPDEAIPSSSFTNKVHSRKKKSEQNLSSNLSTKMETIHIIEPHQIDSRLLRLQTEAIVSQSSLKKKSGTLMYLKNLQQKDDLNSNPDCCPICQTALGDKWCVLQCGHCYCVDCMSELAEKSRVTTIGSIQCAVCRERTPFSDVSCVNLGSTNEEGKDEIPVHGSHSTKVEAVVRRVLKLRNQDPSVKILIFTTWDRVLNVLERALSENGVLYCRLEGGLKNEVALHKFKNLQSEDPFTVLLLPLSMGAKGLNLTEATHVFLVEPILNPAEELQALGRVHRIGQTRPTTVHRFLITGTIEERIYSAMRVTGAEQWSGDCVTIRQLRDLFIVPSTKVNEKENGSSDGVQLVNEDEMQSDICYDVISARSEDQADSQANPSADSQADSQASPQADSQAASQINPRTDSPADSQVSPSADSQSTSHNVLVSDTSSGAGSVGANNEIESEDDTESDVESDGSDY